jgi:uncharacterized protein (DUF2062 family)
MTAPCSGNTPITRISICISLSPRAQNRCSQSARSSRVLGRFTTNSVPATTNIPASRNVRPTARKKFTRSNPRLSSLASRATLRAQSILSEVHSSQSNDNDATQIAEPIHHNWIYRRVALPILALLRMGASPEKLAWSIATGLLIGINPILGSTTVVCLAVAFVFRLNVAASQIGNHIVYPLELFLIIPFINLASRVFHTEPMPLSATELLHAAREHPLELTRRLWLWEWHAFVLWAILAAVAIPILALTLTPILRRLLTRVQHHQYPLIPSA